MDSTTGLTDAQVAEWVTDAEHPDVVRATPVSSARILALAADRAALRERVTAALAMSDHEPTNRVWHEQMQRIRAALATDTTPQCPECQGTGDPAGAGGPNGYGDACKTCGGLGYVYAYGTPTPDATPPSGTWDARVRDNWKRTADAWNPATLDFDATSTEGATDA